MKKHKCQNCGSNKTEFRYKELGVFTYICNVCGSYSHYNGGEYE